MLRLDLKHADYLVFVQTLRSTHERRIHFRVLDSDHRVLSSLTPRFVDGQMTGDVGRDVTRILETTFYDPSRAIHFEPDSPGRVAVHRKRMLQALYSVRVPELQRWVTTPVFTGPVYDFDRTGADVRLVAHGKERLMLDEAGRNRTFPKKTRKTRVLRELFDDAGETFTSIPNLPVTMPERLVVTRMSQRWLKAQAVVGSMSRELFYNGPGTAVLQRTVERPVFTFDARTLMSDVTIDRNPDGLKNTWDVFGADPKGPKPRIHARVELPPRNPVSSKELGRNGKRSYLIEEYENAHIKTRAEALRRGRKMRDDAARTLTSYSFDSLPIPHLEENDLVRVITDNGTFLIRMKQWTLPFGIDGAPVMTVGQVKRTTYASLGRRAS